MNPESPLSVFESVAVASIRPGDVVCFRCQQQLNDAQRAHVAATLDEVFPNFETLILDGGQDIAIVRARPGIFARMLGLYRRD